MSSSAIRRAIISTEHFDLISQNNTYTVAMIKGIGDQAVFCRPGGDRAFLSLIFEHRGKSLTASLSLIPPCEGTVHEERRREAIKLIKDEKSHKRDNVFISLINFNELIRKQNYDGMSGLIELIAHELTLLRFEGRTSQTWSRMNDMISSWLELFSLYDERLEVKGSPTSWEADEQHLSAPVTPIESPRSQPRGPLRLDRVLFLGAEFNAARGDLRSMDDITQEALRGGARAHEPYFKLIKAQLRSLGDPRSVYFDDVSIVPAGGRHSPEEEYRERVALSVWYHRRLLNSFQPNLVVIGGGLATREYLTQVLNPQEFEPARPPVVLQLRNPSQQGHRGPIDSGWIPAYLNHDIYALLSAKLSESPEHLNYRLVIPTENTAPWRVERI